MRILRLIINFYKSFAFASWMITLCCLIITYTSGIQAFVALFWFKMITLGLFFYYINGYKKDEFYYYKNLGASKFLLWSSTLLFDFIAFITLLVVILHIR